MSRESDRIREIYREYDADADRRRRWDPANPGNRAMQRERMAVAHELLTATGLWPGSHHGALEIGAGAGQVIADFRAAGVDDGAFVAVDLVEKRLRSAYALRAARLVADGRALPFRARAFELVLLFTVFSSVGDGDALVAIASEADRVVRPGGGVLVYDVRIPNPANPNTRVVGRRRIEELFPGYATDFRALTVLPPVSRRLGPLTDRVYPVLARAKPLLAHFMGLLIKPE